jgi:hypothetical protein
MVVQGSRIIGNLGRFAVGTNRIATVVFDNLERYIINGEPFSIGQLLIDTATITLSVVAVKGSLDGLKDSIAGFNFAVEHGICFVAGTLITTADGFTPIEEIQVGDEVLAKNYHTGEIALKRVVQTFENETNELVHVHVNGEIISATPEHPFYVAKFGWTSAISLRAGDMLVLSNGEYAVVERVQHEILENPIIVYNFEVEDFHTYFVGTLSVLVHNSCGTLYHYTDASGAAGISESGTINTDEKGRVFLTDEQLSPTDTNNALFMGQKPGTGTFVVEVELLNWNDHNLTGLGTTQPNELIYRGTLRHGRNAILTVRENMFK